MDSSNITLFVIFIALSAFFSGTELALMSLSSHKIESLIKQRKSGALILKQLKQKNERLLITILIGNNLVNVAASALATIAASEFAVALNLSQGAGIAIATGCVTLILLLFGEITPKTLAIKYAENISLAVAPFYKMLMILLLPIVIFAELFLKLISLITGIKSNETDSVSAEDIDAFIGLSNEMGAVEDEEHSQIKGILTMHDTEVRTIMTPRINIVGINENNTIEEATKIFFENSYSRLPVYKQDLDHIESIITFRELIELSNSLDKKTKLSECKLLKPITVPGNQHVNSVLTIFQKSHKHMAIVIDEHGGVDGLVTLEDIVEEVFGEIQDETDKEEQKIIKSKNKIITNGSIAFKDALDALDLTTYDLDTEDAGDYLDENINYIINDILNRFPKNGDSITLGGKLEFNVKEVKGKVIDTLEIKIIGD